MCEFFQIKNKLLLNKIIFIEKLKKISISKFLFL